MTADNGLVDILSRDAHAGIRYGETLARDMAAMPIGPRLQRAAAAAALFYLAARGTPAYPRDLPDRACLRLRFPQLASRQHVGGRTPHSSSGRWP